MHAIRVTEKIINLVRINSTAYERSEQLTFWRNGVGHRCRLRVKNGHNLLRRALPLRQYSVK